MVPDKAKRSTDMVATANRTQQGRSSPRIISRALVLLFLAAMGGGTSFYLLLTVVPLYAASRYGELGAGLTTAVLMLSTVGAELATPRLVARFGYRLVIGAGLLLLGPPALGLTASVDLPAILIVCLVRGLGFGMTVVVGSALVAALVPDERRGEGLGLFGVVVGLPAIVALPLGAWLVGQIGYPVVFVAGGLAALALLPVVAGLPGRERKTAEGAVGIVAALRSAALLRLSMVFSATTFAAGIIFTFLPLAVTQQAGGLAALGLFLQAVATTISRWWAGRYSDRRGSARLLIPGLLTAAVGMLALVVRTSPAAVLGGLVLFGAGFGIVQNASLTLMFEMVTRSAYSAVSALWNLAFDAGMGVGAAVFGVVVVQTGYATAFGLTAAVMAMALVPAWPDSRRAAVEPCEHRATDA